MGRPRVLFLAKHLDSGGVTTHMLTLGEALIELGWDVAVASGGTTGVHDMTPELFASRGIEHFDLAVPELSLSGLARVPKAFADAESITKRFEPDVVHAHWRVTTPCARAVQMRRGIPFVATLHLEPIPSSWPMRAISFWGDQTIAVSKAVRRHLEQNFRVNPERIHVIPNSVDEGFFYRPDPAQRRLARERFGLEIDAPVLCLIGRLEHVKGHDVLIRALSILRQKGKKVVALFAGEGSQREKIEADARSAGVGDDVRFVGFVPSRDVLWASDLLVLPSRKEGFGLVVLEAMLCGVVPIRTPGGGAEEQIEDGVNGFLAPFEDAEILASRIQALLDDPVLAGGMSAASEDSARKRFARGSMGRKTADVYDRCLQ